VSWGKETSGRERGGVGDPRPTRWDGRGRRPASNKSASLIGTFGLTVKLGSATFELLFSVHPKSTNT
jgi:hypothetical protein